VEEGSSKSPGGGTEGQGNGGDGIVVVRGGNLSIDDVVRVARLRTEVRLTDEEEVLRLVEASSAYIIDATEA